MQLAIHVPRRWNPIRFKIKTDLQIVRWRSGEGMPHEGMNEPALGAHQSLPGISLNRLAKGPKRFGMRAQGFIDNRTVVFIVPPAVPLQKQVKPLSAPLFYGKREIVELRSLYRFGGSCDLEKYIMHRRNSLHFLGALNNWTFSLPALAHTGPPL